MPIRTLLKSVGKRQNSSLAKALNPKPGSGLMRLLRFQDLNSPG
jgi:hypothetical protein